MTLRNMKFLRPFKPAVPAGKVKLNFNPNKSQNVVEPVMEISPEVQEE